MPTYVYKFIDTGETIEVAQAFSDDALTAAVHPTSGETRPVKKVFLPVGVSFKGGGFYKTDSRGGSSPSSTTPSTTTGTSTDTSPSSTSTSSDSGSGGSSSSPAAAPAAASTSKAD